MPKYEVLFYESTRGDCPADEFLTSLQPKIRGKIERWIEKLEELGPELPRPYADIVRGKIRELRIRFGVVRYRFLYFFEGHNVIITHGFMKKSSQIPEKEIERAERLMIDFKDRLKKGEIEL